MYDLDESNCTFSPECPYLWVGSELDNTFLLILVDHNACGY